MASQVQFPPTEMERTLLREREVLEAYRKQSVDWKNGVQCSGSSFPEL